MDGNLLRYKLCVALQRGGRKGLSREAFGLDACSLLSLSSYCVHHNTSAIENQAVKLKNKANEVCSMSVCELSTVCHCLIPKCQS